LAIHQVAEPLFRRACKLSPEQRAIDVSLVEADDLLDGIDRWWGRFAGHRG